MDRTQRWEFFRSRFLIAMLGMVLAFACCGVSAAYADAEEVSAVADAGPAQLAAAGPLIVTQDDGFVTADESAIDLNEAWSEQTGGTTKPYTIKESGTYELTGDLETSQQLQVTSGTVVINLNGYTLACSKKGTTAGGGGTLAVKAGAQVIVYGGESGGHRGTIKNAIGVATGDKLAMAVYVGGTSSVRSALTLQGVDIVVEPKLILSDGVDTWPLNEQESNGVFVNGYSDLIICDCRILVDMGKVNNLSPTSTNFHSNVVVDRGLSFFGNGVKAELTDVIVDVKSAPVVNNGKGPEAHALYSQATSSSQSQNEGYVKVRGGSYSAFSPMGTAVAVEAGLLDFMKVEDPQVASNPITLNAFSASASAGVRGRNATSTDPETGARLSGVLLDAPIAFSITNPSDSGASGSGVALTAVANVSEPSFIIGSGFSGNKLTVNTGSMDVGDYFATFDDGLSAEQKDAVVNEMLTSAVDGVQVTYDDNGLTYSIDEAHAAAEMSAESGDCSYFRTIDKALENAAKIDGSIVKLLKPTESRLILPKGESQSASKFTIDLNGKSLAGVNNPYGIGFAGEVTLKDTSSGAKGQVTGPIENSVGGSCIVVDSVDVAAGNSNCAVKGSSGGSVSLTNSNVSLTPSTGAQAINFQGSGTFEAQGGSITVNATSAQTIVGVMIAAGSALSIKDCPIAVTNADGPARALEAVGQVIMESTTDAPLAISCSGTSAAYGVYCATAGSAVSAKNCAFSLNGTGDSADVAVCYMPASAKGAMFTLDGSFEANTARFVLADPLVLGPTFSYTGSHKLVMGTPGTTLDEDIFARGDSNIEGFADIFEADATSIYVDSMVGLSDEGTSLKWLASAAKLSRNGIDTSYATLAGAIAAATQDNDKVTVLKDTFFGEAIEVSKAITLDLNGKNVTLQTEGVEDPESRTYYGVGLSGSNSSLTITDSSTEESKGSFEIEMGNPIGAVSHGENACFYLKDGDNASLVIDGVKVEATYIGAGSGATEFAGVLAAGTASSSTQMIVTLKNEAKLNVDGLGGVRAEGDAFGACKAYGIHLGPFGIRASAAVQAKADIQQGSSVTVNNDSYGFERGTIGTYTGALGTGGEAITEFFPAKDSALYTEIQEAFKAHAKYDGARAFDSSSDSEDKFGSHVYYMEAERLPNGTIVWAYSDKIDESAAGDPDAMVATRFFVQSKYDAPAEAYGVYGTGCVELAGDVKVSAPRGNAYGAYAVAHSPNGASGMSIDWSIGGSVDASGGAGRCRMAADLDMNEVLDLGLDESGAPYRFGGISKLVVYSGFEARGVYIEDTSTAKPILKGAGVKVVVSAKDAVDVESHGAVTLGEDFVYSQGNQLTIISSSAGNIAGGDVALAASGTVSDGAAGWFADPSGVLMPKAGDGKLVWSGMYTIRFYGEGGLLQENGSLKDGETVALPDSGQAARYDESGANGIYEFKGWAKGSKKEYSELDFSQGDIQPSEATVNATESVDYYAVYQYVPQSYKLTFKGGKDENGQALADKTANISYGQTLSEALGDGGDLPAAVDYAADGKAYRFAGWTTNIVVASAWDPELITTSLEFGNTWNTNSGSTFYAKYVEVPAGSFLVKFKNDYMVTPLVVLQGTMPIISSPSKLIKETGKAYEFKGWWLGYSDESLWRDGDGESQLAAANSDATYTARYLESTGKVAVNLYSYAEDGDVLRYKKLSGDDALELPYGSTDVMEKANAKVNPDSFVMDGKQYTFAGWSTRQSDTKPLYPKDGELPALETTAAPTYYAVYSVEDVVADVEFYAGQTKLATAKGALGNATIDQVFESTGLTEAVVPVANGKTFEGWSHAQDAAEKDLTWNLKVSDALAEQGLSSGGTLKYYAVYSGEDAVADIEFYAGQTKLATLKGAFGSDTIDQVFEKTGLTTAVVPVPKGKTFEGWSHDSNASEEELARDLKVSDALAEQGLPVGSTLKYYAVYSGPSEESQNREHCLAELDKAFAGYRQADYTEAGWKELVTCYENGKRGVNDAGTVEEMLAEANAAAQNMAAVPKDNSAAISRAKAAALLTLTQAYADLVANEYTTANRVTLMTAYANAKTAVSSATTAEAASEAANAGVKAMREVPAGDDSKAGIVGTEVTVGKAIYLVTEEDTVQYKKCKATGKKATVPATVKIGGKAYKVTGIAAKAFKGTKVKTLTVKASGLAKSRVKDCFKGAKKLKTVKVPKAKKKAYKKIFKKSVSGKKVKVK